MELIIDILVYFSLIFSLLFLINRFIFKIKLSRKALIIIYIIATILFGIEVFFATIFETSFSIKRDFGIEVKQTGFKFYSSEEEREIYNKLHQ